MAKISDKIIIDTNLWISYLISKDFKQLDLLFRNDAIKLIFSDELLEEFIVVSKREKFKKYFNKKSINKLMKLIDSVAIFVEVKSKVDICRDKKDNFLLSLSKDSNADYLITGDKDLLDLRKYYKTKIVTISEYLKTYDYF